MILQLQRASQSYDECGGGEQLEARQHYLNNRPAAKYKRQRWGSRYYHLYNKDNFKEMIIELIILIEEQDISMKWQQQKLSKMCLAV